MSDTRLCPRCHYVRRDQDQDTLAGVCPACGIAYHKWTVQQAAASGDQPAQQAPPRSLYDKAPTREGMDIFRYQFLYMQSDRDESVFWAHIVIYILVTLWGGWLMIGGIDFSVTGSSFLHVVNSPFHQYGHVVFSPFGGTVALLGGSMLQILVPLAAFAYFTLLHYDNFPASLMLWWAGENFLDIAPYIADAPTRLIAVPEGDPGQHDWYALLGNSPASQGLSQAVFLIGVVIMLLSNYWGYQLLRIEFTGRTAPPPNLD